MEAHDGWGGMRMKKGDEEWVQLGGWQRKGG